ncbi:hypothetical protein E2C01_025134 [Portunus trituberculatus]|uniref:Uncharacterized protein n=1 Tax=Portunus trituberculatus TaxID=210409 RepID=A0A5B7EH10_PORTR|nr:hypothetical protein [Portunus trituberculatus]
MMTVIMCCVHLGGWGKSCVAGGAGLPNPQLNSDKNLITLGVRGRGGGEGQPAARRLDAALTTPAGGRGSPPCMCLRKKPKHPIRPCRANETDGDRNQQGPKAAVPSVTSTMCDCAADAVSDEQAQVVAVVTGVAVVVVVVLMVAVMIVMAVVEVEGFKATPGQISQEGR